MRFDLEEQNIDMKYIEDSSNVETLHFPFLRSLFEWISTSGQFSMSNLHEMLDLCIIVNSCRFICCVFTLYMGCTPPL